MPTAVLIANPSASQFTGGAFRRIRATLERGYELRTEWPISPQETDVTSTAAAMEGTDAVFAMGGDGVAHHVANALIGTETALGIIPVGTTNVLARILGVPMNPAKAAEAAMEYPAIPTRMVRIDAEASHGTRIRHAAFSVGFGFDADVVEASDARPFAKSRFGGVYYASTAVARLVSTWRNERPTLRITCDGDRFDAVAVLTQVHNPYTFFGRFPLHLTPRPPEGIATLAADDLGVTHATEIFLRAALGIAHRDAAGTRLWTDHRQLTIEAEPPSPYQADGELLGHAHRAVITPREGAIRVLRPHGRLPGDETDDVVRHT